MARIFFSLDRILLYKLWWSGLLDIEQTDLGLSCLSLPLDFILIFQVFLCVDLRKLEKRVSYPRSGVIDDGELRNMGAGNHTRVLQWP